MLNALMTVYDECEYVEYAIKSCLPFVDNLVIVEGAYQQTIALGKSPRSTDGTLDVIKKFVKEKKIHYVEANEVSDPQQRNVGLEIIKKLDPNGWMHIIDGDEIYEPQTFGLIRALTSSLKKSNQYAAYFKSLTFVNDFQHYTEQEFPRLFKLTPECAFFNDNFMHWNGVPWSQPHVIKLPYIKYFHYAFCKNANRFQMKRDWWQNRGLGENFDYGWKMDENGKIVDKSHKIYCFNGKHPAIMDSHPLNLGVKE